MIASRAVGFDLSQLPLEASLSLLALIAAIAGVINTMAGGGSLLVIPLMIALGLPPSVANGTLRVGVIVQNVGSLFTFHHKGVHDYRLVAKLAAPMIAGALVGSYLATRLSDEILRPLFGIVLAGWAIVLVVRPGRFLSPPEQPVEPGLGAMFVSLLVGWYGGFLQAGVGFPLMALLISMLGHPPVRANAVKIALVFAFTLVSLPMFAVAGQVAWREGAALAVGSLVGGWLGAAWQIRSGAAVVRWFVVIAVAVSGVAMVVAG